MLIRRLYNHLFIALALLVSGCHFAPLPHTKAWDQMPPGAQRARIVEDARNFVHSREIVVGTRTFPYDCSGLVGAVLYRSGIDIFQSATELQIKGNGVRILYQYVTKYGTVHQKGMPQPGDLVFFSNTYDRNRDGKLNDRLTHVGVVETVDRNGTISFIHNVRRGVRRYVMNLRYPHRHKDRNQKVLNSYLRRRTRRDGPGTPYLAGALYSGFGSLIRAPGS